MKDDSKRFGDHEEPRIFAVSRRALVPMTAAAATGALLGVASLAPPAAAEGTAAKPGTVTLPDWPSPNPAFLAHFLSDGGVLVWTVRPPGETVAYRLNTAGRLVWELADGSRSPEAIAEAYAATSRRAATEATAFLATLERAAVLACGGHVVAKGDFPLPENGVYRPRVSGVRMNRG